MPDSFTDDITDVPPGEETDNHTSRTVNVKSILDAPDYTDFVRRPKTATAREYEKKTASLMKAGMVASINTGNLADAATFIHFGPGFAAAAGDYAATDERAARMIDMITTPASPALAFVLAAAPLISQFARNHEDVIRDIPEIRQKRRMRKREQAAQETPRMDFRIPLIGRHVSFKMRVRFKLLRNLTSGFRKTTYEPDMLTIKVFTDDKLRAALHKQGIDIHVTEGTDGT